MKLVRELVRTPLQRIYAGVSNDSCRGSLTASGVPLQLAKELAKNRLQRINAGPIGQSGALLAVSAVVLMSHRMQNSKRPFELSWLHEVPMEVVNELSKTPLERSHGAISATRASAP